MRLGSLSQSDLYFTPTAADKIKTIFGLGAVIANSSDLAIERRVIIISGSIMLETTLILILILILILLIPHYVLLWILRLQVIFRWMFLLTR